ncbi:MAG: hypothetical protein JWP98_1498 [Edaphobacter sp.]|jgi:hypothetical protein|nr:hypothetical protein [Edaphobacter sp.]
MELFARLEANRFAWSDRDFGTGSGIATDTRLPGLNGEDAEAAKFNAVSSDQGLLHAIEDGVYRSLCFCSWQAGTLNNPLYKILLNHSGPPSLGCNFLF